MFNMQSSARQPAKPHATFSPHGKPHNFPRHCHAALRLRASGAPLQARIDHYIRLLFPKAALEIGDDLLPGLLTRPAMQGEESGAVSELSHGAREQMGVLTRLAYADLLQEAGRPTLLILDDALVHSDTQRLDRMKRVLFDAAQRHQVLLFTCHPAAWRDMGVVARTIMRG